MWQRLDHAKAGSTLLFVAADSFALPPWMPQIHLAQELVLEVEQAPSKGPAPLKRFHHGWLVETATLALVAAVQAMSVEGFCPCDLTLEPIVDVNAWV